MAIKRVMRVYEANHFVHVHEMVQTLESLKTKKPNP